MGRHGCSRQRRASARPVDRRSLGNDVELIAERRQEPRERPRQLAARQPRSTAGRSPTRRCRATASCCSPPGSTPWSTRWPSAWTHLAGDPGAAGQAARRSFADPRGGRGDIAPLRRRARLPQRRRRRRIPRHLARGRRAGHADAAGRQSRSGAISRSDALRPRPREQGAYDLQQRAAPLHRLASGPDRTERAVRGMAAADAERADTGGRTSTYRTGILFAVASLPLVWDVAV